MSIFLGWHNHLPWVTFEPIVRHIELRWPPDDFQDIDTVGPRWSNRFIARLTGLDGASVQRRRSSNRISVYAADDICAAGLAVNPSTVYGPEWYEIPVDVPLCVDRRQRECAKRMWRDHGHSSAFDVVLTENDGIVPLRLPEREVAC